MVSQSYRDIRVSKYATKKGLTPRQYQLDGVRAMLDAGVGTFAVWDEMGVGKTIQALMYMNSIFARNVLILCSSSLRLNWFREACFWYDVRNQPHSGFPILKSADLDIINRENAFKRGYIPSPLICSYDLLVRGDPAVMRYIMSRDFDGLIFDEFQECRNIGAQRTRAVLQVWDKNVNAQTLLLTGTPMENSAEDLFPSMYMCAMQTETLKEADYAICEDYEEFANTFTFRHRTQFGMKCRGMRNELWLKSIIKRGGFSLRRRLADVEKEIPELSFNTVDLDLKTKVSAEEQAYIDRFFDSLEKSETEKKENESLREKGFRNLSSLRRMLGEAKAAQPDTWEFIESCIKEHGCVFVVFYHTLVKDILLAKAKKAGYKCVVHDGKTTATNKQKAVDDFQDGKAQVFFGQVEGAKGYTITKACDVVFVEYSWLSTRVFQAIGRLLRIGQLRPVTAHFIIDVSLALDKKLVRGFLARQKKINLLHDEEA